ncbi:DUF4349 domain-containing protein [Oceanobacillus piezotolerans]|uniref:DUF4349 domain-containing protein n=1 Tax=Oceanobacillus piezotolerans TaxID=2448030 RepID=A0A498DJZ0_9BACI|nr:DUF4349 domain-containing protein [Oceanobacillus piezotolerans]RLL46792.1 DUF4349 domain-containing protein [Oceanobacillus piezotolerans]
MKKRKIMLWLLILSVIVSACSNTGEESSMEANYDMENSSEEMEIAEPETPSEEFSEAEESAPAQDNEEQVQQVETNTERKIIYNAHLNVEVKNFESSYTNIQNQVAEFDGYVVESSTFGATEGNPPSGQITARIPQTDFRSFIQLVEDGSSKVIDSSVSGQDVTEEYVDLESRLSSKQVVEKRLLGFMEQAEKTEDLLAISNDLATVQEEIEQIVGRMNYLENKSDLATVTIFLQENNTSLPSEGELNTWEKTKDQFMKSIHFLITAASAIFVFVVGNILLFLLVGVLVLFTYLFVRRKRKNHPE